MAEMLVPGGSAMRICPAWLQGWLSLCEKAVNKWLDDRAPTMGAAIAYYTVFSLAPMLVMVIAVAGLAFGQKAAEGALFGELADLIGAESAIAVQAMLRTASDTGSGIFATAVGIGTLVIAATAVLGELQSALNVIWKVPAKWRARPLASPKIASSEPRGHPRYRLPAAGVAGYQHGVGTAFSDYLDWLLPGLATILRIVHLILSFAFTTVLFAMIFKILPDSPVEWKEVWLGAVIAALLFTLGKHLISLYIGSSNMASAYGVAGALIIVLVWIYYSAQILLLGAEFAKAYSDRRQALREARGTSVGVSD